MVAHWLRAHIAFAEYLSLNPRTNIVTTTCISRSKRTLWPSCALILTQTHLHTHKYKEILKEFFISLISRCCSHITEITKEDIKDNWNEESAFPYLTVIFNLSASGTTGCGRNIMKVIRGCIGQQREVKFMGSIVTKLHAYVLVVFPQGLMVDSALLAILECSHVI